MDNPYEWLQALIDRVPDLLQPLIVALAAAVPYVEGEGAAALGILAGINPVLAALAGAAGNIACVVVVVLLGSRIRGAATRRRARTAAADSAEDALVTSSARSGAAAGRGGATTSPTASGTGSRDADAGLVDDVRGDPAQKADRGAKGRARLRRWMLRFGVPVASLLAPLALPTMLTAAFFVASGVRKEWVILWQVVAVVLWTGAVAAAATGVLAVLGW